LGQLVVKTEPVPADEITLERDRPLLVLGRKHQATDLGLDPIEGGLAFPLRMQNLAATPGDPFPLSPSMTLSSTAMSGKSK
jgi:hypothetical protein